MFKKLLFVCGVVLSACDDTGHRNILKTRRLETYGECFSLCQTAPVEVRWDSVGNLVSCRCDYDYVVASEEDVVVAR
jgi:hypothetical protein